MVEWLRQGEYSGGLRWGTRSFWNRSSGKKRPGTKERAHERDPGNEKGEEEQETYHVGFAFPAKPARGLRGSYTIGLEKLSHFGVEILACSTPTASRSRQSAAPACRFRRVRSRSRSSARSSGIVSCPPAVASIAFGVWRRQPWRSSSGSPSKTASRPTSSCARCGRCREMARTIDPSRPSLAPQIGDV